MSVTMHQTRRDDLLKRVERPDPAKADLLNKVEKGSVLRIAILRAGMNQDEAMDALGVKDKGQFSRMLDGKEQLGIQRVLRPEAVTIWRAIVILHAEQSGYEVEQVIRMREAR